jgi:SAM-dependent methyltransferase
VDYGFPCAHVSLLRCPHDAGALTVVGGRGQAGDRLTNGALRCNACRRDFPVSGGIVRLLEDDGQDAEGAHERGLRDAHAEAEYDHSRARPADNAMEIGPMLAALEVDRTSTVLELGCGTGRYTVLLAGDCAAVLAVDFSLESLRILARRLGPDAPVGLVLADITRLAVAGGGFDRCLSTLVSNLPTPAHRKAMYRLAAGALHPDGRFVFGTHHYGLLARWNRVPKVGRYSEGGIYREYFRPREVSREARAFFGTVRARPIQVGLPGARRLGLSPDVVSRLVERIPGLNTFGRLVLVAADGPLRPSPG